MVERARVDCAVGGVGVPAVPSCASRETVSALSSVSEAVPTPGVALKSTVTSRVGAVPSGAVLSPENVINWLLLL